MKIQSVKGREVIDSRGNPTVEAVVTLDNGIVANAMVPSRHLPVRESCGIKG